MYSTSSPVDSLPTVRESAATMTDALVGGEVALELAGAASAEPMKGTATSITVASAVPA